MRPLIVESIACLLVMALAFWGVSGAVEGALEGAAVRGGDTLRTPAEVWSMAWSCLWYFFGGAVALYLGRLASAMRSGKHITVPFLLPAVLGAITLGFLLQLGYGDPLRAAGWPGPQFARGVFFAGIIGGLILGIPWDPARLFHRLQNVLIIAIMLVFVALSFFGSGPSGSGTRINLGPIQPIEAVKVGFIIFLAIYLGSRAAKIRYQRRKAGFLRLPRPRLLLPAIVVLVGVFMALFMVRDLGPTLILFMVVLCLFYVVTRSPGWVAIALLLVAALLVLLVINPDIVGGSGVALRIRMWLDPWYNGLANGDQLAAARWAIAAGTMMGQGLGHGAIAALPAGHTDLIMAHLAEELGFRGVAFYLVMLGLVVAQGFRVAINSRTPERSMLATGLSVLLFAQWAVIAGGTLGLIPLTGVVVPYLSYGKTSMATFLAVTALLGKLAENGMVREPTDELQELAMGIKRVATALGLMLAMGFAASFWQGVMMASSISAHGLVTTLGDGSVIHRHDPRVAAIAKAIPRGEIRDRNGKIIVGSDSEGRRVYPLGDAMGTLIGPARGDVLRPRWSIERIFDVRLRGYPDLEDGPAVWRVATDSGEKLLFVVDSRKEREEDRLLAQRKAKALAQDPEKIRLLPLPAPDLGPMVELLQVPWSRRAEAIEKVALDTDSRAVTLSLDAALQVAAVEALKKAAKRGKAAAAIVMDVDTGQVLARAQVPDYNPGDEEQWKPPLIDRDPEFTGVYGPWSDKTGVLGFYQAGSVFKLFTSVAAVRQGAGYGGEQCLVTGVETFKCLERDKQGPFFTLPHWRRSIHDYWKDRNHGELDITQAIAVSCNVFFAQLGLELGPEPFVQLVSDGLEVGWSSTFDPGPAESRRLASTAFGQGAAALSVAQAARLVTLIGGGGVYRKCDSSMELDAPCSQTPLVQDTEGLTLVLSGMRKVMHSGTGHRLKKIQGVRVYGKTGTGDAVGLQEEEPYGITPGSRREQPHSWFVAIAEPASADPCASLVHGRLALAVVVPRGGTGAGAAGTAALEIIAAAHELGYFPEGG